MKIIKSTSNPIIKEFVALHSKKGRDKQAQFLLEGIKSVEEAIKSGLKITKIALNENQHIDLDLLKNIEDYYLLSDACMKKVSTTDTPSVIVAIAEKLTFKIEPLIKTSPEHQKLILVLDEIRDPGNLGTIIRTAAAANADGIIITDCSVDIYNTKVIRSSAGCLWKLPVVYIEDKTKLIKLLKSNNFKIYSTSLSTDTSYTDVSYNNNIAIVFGSESCGISESLLSASEKIIKIPIRKNVESLNLASSVAIIIFEAIRQKGINFDTTRKSGR